MRVAVTWRPEYIISEFEIEANDMEQMLRDGVDLEDGRAIEEWLEKQPWYEEYVTDVWNETERTTRPTIEQVEITDDDGFIV